MMLNSVREVYDNGYKLLGTKQNILLYLNNIQKTKEDLEDYEKESIEDIISSLKDLDNKTIVMVNYDYDCFNYSIDYWENKDRKGVI